MRSAASVSSAPAEQRQLVRAFLDPTPLVASKILFLMAAENPWCSRIPLPHNFGNGVKTNSNPPQLAQLEMTEEFLAAFV